MIRSPRSEHALQDAILSLTIPAKLPSLNVLRKHPGGRGRFASTAWRRAFEREIPPIVGRALRCTVRAEVEIVRYLGPRERPYDTDNLYGGCKPLLDALRAHGYIAGDSPDLLTLSVRQAADLAGPRIEVRIRRLALQPGETRTVTEHPASRVIRYDHGQGAHRRTG